MGRKKTVLITGCSSGIGKALAREFHERGFVVFAGARRVHLMKDLEAIGIIVVRLDVTDEECIENVRRKVEVVSGGKLDLLYNNAGQAYTCPAGDVSIDLARKCFDVNVFGTMAMVRAFIPMVIAARGTIANTGSISAIVQFPYSTVYSASKAALHQYCNGLRLELAPFGVDVVTVVTCAVRSSLSDYRPLPPGSLYTVLADGVKLRAQLSGRSNPMSATEYAKRVFRQVSKLHPKPIFWEGSNWMKLWVLFYLLPRKLTDYILMRKFKLLEYFARLRNYRSYR